MKQMSWLSSVPDVGRQASLRDGADTLLCHGTEGEECPFEGRLRERVERIGLVLSSIPSSQDLDPVAFPVDSSVMARGNVPTVQGRSRLDQSRPLHEGIASDARIRGAARRVIGAEGVDDRFLEVVGAVDNVVWNLEPFADLPCPLDRGNRRAIRVGFEIAFPSVNELERHALNIEPLFLEQQGRDRRIHAAAHRYQNTFFIHL